MFKLVQAFVLSTQLLDTSSTVIRLNEANVIEQNKLLSNNPYQIVAIKSGITVGELYLLDKLHKKHLKAAIITGLVVGSIPLAAGIHNIKLR